MQCKPFLTRVAKLVWSQSQYQSFNKFLESLLRLLLRQEDQTFGWLLPQLSIKELSNCVAYILDTFKVGKVGMNEESCKKACRSRKKVREERCTGRKIHFSHYFLQSTMCYLLLNLQIRKQSLFSWFCLQILICWPRMFLKGKASVVLGIMHMCA